MTGEKRYVTVRKGVAPMAGFFLVSCVHLRLSEKGVDAPWRKESEEGRGKDSGGTDYLQGHRYFSSKAQWGGKQGKNLTLGRRAENNSGGGDGSYGSSNGLYF